MHSAIEPVVPYYPTSAERGQDLSLLYGPLKEQLFVYLLCTCTSWAAAVASQGGQKASVNDEGGQRTKHEAATFAAALAPILVRRRRSI